MDMQALIEEMSHLVGRIKSGEATRGELEAFTAAAAELHERAVVLRYKSYEAQIYGTPVQPVQEFRHELESPVETAAETPSAQAEPEPAKESEPADEKAETPQPASDEMSFDLFDEPSSDNEAAFDLFSLDTEETYEELAQMEEKPEQEGAPKENPVAEAPVKEEAAVPPHSQFEPAAPVMEETALEEISAMSDGFTSGKAAAPAPDPAASVKEETPPHKDESAGVTSVKAQDPASGDIHPLYKRLVTDDNSLAARLMAVRLETLKGAFGFNERLQIIRELFDGSGDEFSHAIEQLDSLGSRNEARSVVSGYARRFRWDKDSDLALEFVQKVERRYA